MKDGAEALVHQFPVITEIRDEEDPSEYLIIFQYQRDGQMFLGHIRQSFI